MSVAVISLLLLAQTEPISRVGRVTVYADRAEVTRLLQLDCPRGQVEARFPAIPAAADERTLRAEASGRAKAAGTFSRLVPAEEDRDSRRAASQAALEAAQDRWRAMEHQRLRSAERERSVGELAGYLGQTMTEQMRNAAPPLEGWRRALESVRTERGAEGQRRLALQVEQRKLSREIERLSQRVATLSAAERPREVRAVTVAVDCQGEPRPEVSLSYVLPGATWHPEYDLRFTPDGGQKTGKGRVEVVVGAVVQQATGEDWNDVELALSTAKPRLGAEAPYPAPLLVSGYETEEERRLVQATERREASLGEGQGQAAAGPRSAALEDGGRVFVLRLPHKVAVLADGHPYWMPVDEVAGRGESRLVAVPKRSPYVYQVVALKNPASYPLLAGRVHAHRSGAYVGDQALRYVAPGEPFELSLGLDEELKVERKSLREVDSGPKFLGSTKAWEREYRLRLQSQAASRVTLEVRESVPVSKVEDVTVEIDRARTARGFRLDQERGFLTWAVELSPGEVKELDLVYTVRIPKSWAGQ